jgi:tetratricopeptide (TPR) repeat protein
MGKNGPENNIDISGNIHGIGNVIGDHSASKVELHLSLLTIIKNGNNGTSMELNPHYTADVTMPFSPHPDEILPELEHLIGHKNELKRLLQLYEHASHEGTGTVVFISGQPGYGANTLGRTFIDAVCRGGGRGAITRFWPNESEKHTRRDPRWRSGFEKYADTIQYAPDFLRKPDMFVFWPIVFQIYKQFQLAENIKLPSSIREIPSYLRSFTHPRAPLVLLLEDFEHAGRDWRELISYLTPELAEGLPILFIVTMHTEKPVDQVPAAMLNLVQMFALDLARNNQAEIYHLSRVYRTDVEDYITPAQTDVVEILHRLAGGLPMLIQDLWKEWVNREVVIRDEDGLWCLASDSLFRTFGTGRDYIRNKMEDLWPFEYEAPWSADQMLDMLALAACEGITFTPEGLASTFDVSLRDLVFGLEYLLDEPDDPGLVVQAGSINLSLPSANWEKSIEQFTFSPSLVWYILRSQQSQTDQLTKYARNLRKAFWPFPERCGSTMAHLYEQAGDATQVQACRQLINHDDPLTTMMAQAEWLLLDPECDCDSTLSRLRYYANELYHASIINNNPQYAYGFYQKVSLLTENAKWRDFHAEVLFFLGSAFFALGDYDQARERFLNALSINEEIERTGETADDLRGLGEVAFAIGEYPTSREYFQRALAIKEKLGLMYQISVILHNLGTVSRTLGEYDAAGKYFQRGLAIEEEIGNSDGISVHLNALGDLSLNIGDYDAAAKYFRRSLVIGEELGNKSSLSSNLSGLGDVALALGEYNAARENYQRSLAIEEGLGRKGEIAVVLIHLGEINLILKEYDTAQECFLRAMTINENIGRNAEIVGSLIGLGNVAKAQGKYAAARVHYRRALDIGEKLNRKDWIASTLSGMGDVAKDLGKISTARKYYLRALSMGEEFDSKSLIISFLEDLGDLEGSASNNNISLKYYRRALKILEYTKQKHRIIRIRKKIKLLSKI